MTAVGTEARTMRALLDGVADQRLPGQRCRWLVVGMSRDDNPKTTAMLFAEGGAEPVVAVKLATTRVAAEAIRAEARALQTMSALDPGRLGASVPMLMDVRGGDRGCALVMSVVPGRPLSLDYHRHGHISRPALVGADLRQAADWLTRLRAVPIDVAPTGAASADWAAVIRDRWPSWETAQQASTAADRVRQRLGSADRTCVAHGDFWCGNVLRSDRHVSGVVDWEHLRVDGDPIDDPVRMAVSYSLYLDRHTRVGRQVPGHHGLTSGEWGAGLSHAISGRGWYADLLAEFLGDALRAGGRDPTMWRDALLWGVAAVAGSADEDRFARNHVRLLAEVAS